MKIIIMKKVVSLILIVTMILTQLPLIAFTSGSIESFPDIRGHYAESIINEWAKNAFITGLPDGSFAPDSYITRAEFIAIMNSAFKFEEKPSNQNTFSDVTSTNWYYSDVMLAANLGIVSGYPGGNFGAENLISRQDACVIISHYLLLTENYDQSYFNNFLDKDKVSDYAVSHVAAMAEMKYINGRTSGNFAPQDKITRADSVLMLNNVYETIEQSSGIIGRIYYENKILANAEISISKSGEYAPLILSKSDSEGGFLIKLNEGEYDIVVTKDDYVTYLSHVVVSEGKLTSIKMTLKQGQKVTAILKNQKGDALTNTSLYFKTNPFFKVTTNEKGVVSTVLPFEREYEIFSFIDGTLKKISNFNTKNSLVTTDLGEIIIKPNNDTIISPSFEMENREYTRGEWIKVLAEKIGISSNIIENEFDYFYGDTEDLEYGDIIETVNALGIIPPPDSEGYIEPTQDIPLFEPNKIATREFVAFTLAKALGFTGSYTLDYDDSDNVEFSSEVAVVIQAGFLNLENNKFNPMSGISISEKDQIFTTIDALNESVKIDSSEFQDVVTLQNGVLSIDENEYSITDNGNNTFTITLKKSTNTNELIEGSVFVLPPSEAYPGGIPFKVSSIQDGEGQLTVYCIKPVLEEVISDFHFAGYAIADIANMSVSNGVFAEYEPNGVVISGNEELSPFDIGDVSNPGKATFTLVKKPIGDTGINVTGKFEVNIPTIVVKADGNVTLFDGLEIEEMLVSVKSEFEVSSNLEYDFGVPEANYDVSTGKQILGTGKTELGRVPFALGASGFTLDLVVFLNIDLSGTASISFSVEGTNGFHYKDGILRDLNSYDTKFTLLELNATAKIGLGLSVRLTILSIFDLAGIDAHGGLGVTAKFTPRILSEPDLYCSDSSIYFYATLEVVSDTLLGNMMKEFYDMELTLEIFDEDNSPFKRKLHLENGQTTPKCTFGYGSLRGIIKDATSSIPIQGARVELYNKTTNKLLKTYYSARTNSVDVVMGEFITKDIPVGIYRMKVMATGYEANIHEVVILNNQQNNCEPTMLIKRELIEEPSEISVQVHIKNSKTNEGLSGVNYKVRKGNDTTEGDTVLSGLFDNEIGTFDMMTGNYTIEFTINNFETTYKNVSILSNVENSIDVFITPVQDVPDPEIPEIVVEVSGAIKIKDMDYDLTNNAPLSSATVNLTNIDTLDSIQVYSDLDGTFSFSNVKMGDYVIRVSMTNYSSETIFINIKGDFNKEFNLVREGTRIINPSSIISIHDTIFGINNYGEVYVWGQYNEDITGIKCDFTRYTDDYGFVEDIINKATKIKPLENIVQIATNSSSVVMAVDYNGNLWQWGKTDRHSVSGIFGNGDQSTYPSISAPTRNTKINDVKKVAISYLNSYVLKNDGTVWTAGNLEVSGLYDYENYDSNNGFTLYDYTKIDGLSGIVSIIATYYGFYALDQEGNLWSVGLDWINGNGREYYYFPQIILTNIKSISTSTTDSEAIALSNEGDLFVWGDKLYNNSDVLTPMIILSDVKYANVLNSGNFIAIKKDGTSWGIGCNISGELGDGTFEDKESPALALNGLSEVTEIIPLGYSSTLIKLEDGSLYITGDNYYGTWGDSYDRLNKVNIPFKISNILVE